MQMRRTLGGEACAEQTAPRRKRASLKEFVRIDTGEIGDEPVRLATPKLVDGKDTGGDGEDFGLDGVAAFDVARSIADDEDFFAGEFCAKEFGAAVACDGGDLVAVFVVIAIRAHGEGIPEAVMGELQESALFDVAREETDERAMGHGAESGDEFVDTGKDVAVEGDEHAFEPNDVSAKEAREMLRRGRDAEELKELADDGRVRAASEPDVFGGVGDVEFLLADFGESFFARAAGFDECAVDVEKDEADHRQRDEKVAALRR